MTNPTSERRVPGWTVLAALTVIVAIATWIILAGARR
jgi:hypothetical protein